MQQATQERRLKQLMMFRVVMITTLLLIAVYVEEVDQAVANMLTLMEPVMILFLGTTVGGIVISMYLPLFDLISKLS